jgi:DNA primase
MPVSQRAHAAFHGRPTRLYHCFGVEQEGTSSTSCGDRSARPRPWRRSPHGWREEDPERASRGPRDDRREKLLEVLAAAQRFYSAELGKPGSRAEAYLAKRGVPEEFVKRLALGHAPDSWDALTAALGGAYPESLLAEAGLVQPRSEGRGHYDRFRDRLLFVVRDERGRAVGFGGRALSPEQEPKYLNSPESPVFLKKRLLYGLSEARDSIRKHHRVVLVEGYFDHLALLQAGVDETVASMGTALTPEQAEKGAPCPPSSFATTATRGGAANTLAAPLAQGFRARVARLPEGQDPHDVPTQGPGVGWRIKTRPTFLDFFETQPERFGW